MSHGGRLEVICGSMFSGKSEELIRRLNRARIAKQKVQVFKPALDTRFANVDVVSHSGLSVQALSISHPEEILRLLEPDTRVVGVDEVQFFSMEIVDLCSRLADAGLRVVVAGLDQDFRGEPFGPMARLLAVAEEADKLQAICVVCGEVASRSQRLIDGLPAPYDSPTIQVGASEQYEARCRHCHQVPKSPVAQPLTLFAEPKGTR